MDVVKTATALCVWVVALFSAVVAPAGIKNADKVAVRAYVARNRDAYLEETRRLHAQCQKSCGGKVSFATKTMSVAPRKVVIRLSPTVQSGNLPKLGGDVVIQDVSLGFDNRAGLLELPVTPGRYFLTQTTGGKRIASFLELGISGKVYRVKVEKRSDTDAQGRPVCVVRRTEELLYSGSLVPYVLQGALNLALDGPFAINKELSWSDSLVLTPTKEAQPGAYVLKATLSWPGLSTAVPAGRYGRPCKTIRMPPLAETQRATAVVRFSAVRVVGFTVADRTWKMEGRKLKIELSDADPSESVPFTPILDNGQRKKPLSAFPPYSYFLAPRKGAFRYAVVRNTGVELAGSIEDATWQLAADALPGALASVTVRMTGAPFPPVELRFGRPRFSFRIAGSKLMEEPVYTGKGEITSVHRYHPVSAFTPVDLEVVGEGVLFPEQYEVSCSGTGLTPETGGVHLQPDREGAAGKCRFRLSEETRQSLLHGWAASGKVSGGAEARAEVRQGKRRKVASGRLAIRFVRPEISAVRTVFGTTSLSSVADIFVSPDGNKGSPVCISGELTLADGSTVVIPARRDTPLTVRAGRGADSTLTEATGNCYGVKGAAASPIQVRVVYRQPGGDERPGAPGTITVNTAYVLRTGTRHFSLVAKGEANLSTYKAEWEYFQRGALRSVTTTFRGSGGKKWVASFDLPEGATAVGVTLLSSGGERKISFFLPSHTDVYTASFTGPIQGPAIMRAGRKYLLSARFNARLPADELGRIQCLWRVTGEGVGIASKGRPEIRNRTEGRCQAEVYVEQGPARLADIAVSLVEK